MPLLAAGCEAVKSSNPLSPSVAGPIPGVSISAPRLVDPAHGAEIMKDRQPVTLVVENATTTGVRPLTYLFEVASDPDFNNRLFSREGISPGEGRTSVKLPSALDPERTYYWRARAQDGANTGPFASSVSFRVKTPVVLAAPDLASPVNGERLATVNPTFVVRNAARSGPVGAVGYTVQISANDSFTALAFVATIAEKSGQTSFTMAQPLQLDKLYFWRARAFDSQNTGAWSITQTFRTPAAPAVPAPAPIPAPPPGGSGSCASTNGQYIAQCIAAKYPAYLVRTSTLAQRQRNMAFLRDRMIEAAICGGMDGGWNLKRCGSDLSLDYMTVRVNGKVWGVDVAADYDNIGAPLRLGWLQKDDPFACYKAYTPRPTCN